MNNKIFLTIILGIFLFSTASASIEVILNSPADGSIAYVQPVTFNASANVTGGANLVNMSLWTNISGSWAISNTTEISTELNYNSTSKTVDTFYYQLNFTDKNNVNILFKQTGATASYTSSGVNNAGNIGYCNFINVNRVFEREELKIEK